VTGAWSPKCRQVDAPLDKYVIQSGRRLVHVNQSGKWSLTRYRLLRELVGPLGHFSLLEAQPVTGRTHQIRVHCQYAGHVIVGDDKYGDDQINQRLRKVGLQRLFLHARMLRLKDPLSGQDVEVVAPMDAQMQGILSYLQSGRPTPIDTTYERDLLHEPL